MNWIDRADEIIKEIAINNSFVISDMVIAQLEKEGLKQSNYAALGGVFTRAARARIIKKRDTEQKSNSKKIVWSSLIYKGADLND